MLEEFEDWYVCVKRAATSTLTRAMNVFLNIEQVNVILKKEAMAVCLKLTNSGH